MLASIEIAKHTLLVGGVVLALGTISGLIAQKAKIPDVAVFPIIGMAIEAVNLGYRVAVLSDGVSGLPAEFVDDMLRHSLRLLGPTPTTQDVLAAWHGR